MYIFKDGLIQVELWILALEKLIQFNILIYVWAHFDTPKHSFYI